MMNIDDLQREHDLLGRQIAEIDHQLNRLKPKIAMLVIALKRNDATEGHSKRMWRLTKERNHLIEERSNIETKLQNISAQLMESRRLSSYNNKIFCRSFVEIARERLPYLAFEEIKLAALQRCTGA